MSLERCSQCSHPLTLNDDPFGRIMRFVCETCADAEDSDVDEDTEGVMVLPRAENGKALP